VREWLASLEPVQLAAAVFDTRINVPRLLSGRASKKIERALSHLGFDIVAPPESFLVNRASHLLPGEVDRARAWGARLASMPLRERRVR
jgi:hypothetical protein